MIEILLWVFAVIVAGGVGYFFGGLHAASIAVSAFEAEHTRWQAEKNALMQKVSQLQQDALVKEQEDGQ